MKAKDTIAHRTIVLSPIKLESKGTYNLYRLTSCFAFSYG